VYTQVQYRSTGSIASRPEYSQVRSRSTGPRRPRSTGPFDLYVRSTGPVSMCPCRVQGRSKSTGLLLYGSTGPPRLSATLDQVHLPGQLVHIASRPGQLAGPVSCRFAKSKSKVNWLVSRTGRPPGPSALLSLPRPHSKRSPLRPRTRSGSLMGRTDHGQAYAQ
jgi:hypothetical protein